MLDLACGDGGLGEHLLARGLGLRGRRRRSRRWSRRHARRLGDRAAVEAGDLNRYAPAQPVAATTVFRAIYYADDRARVLRARRGLHRAEARLRPQPASVSAVGGRASELRAAGLPAHRAAAVLRPADASAALRSRRGALKAPRAHRARSRGSRSARASRTSSRPCARGRRRTSTRAPSARRSPPLVSGSTSAGTKVSISTSARHGPSGVGSTTVRRRAGGHVDRLGARLARDRGLLVGAAAELADPDAGDARQPDVCRAERRAGQRDHGRPCPALRDVEPVVGRARGHATGRPGRRRLQPSAEIPVSFDRSRIGPSRRTSVAFASGFAATSSPTTSTPFDASTKSVCGSGQSVPSTSWRSGVSV